MPKIDIETVPEIRRCGYPTPYDQPCLERVRKALGNYKLTSPQHPGRRTRRPPCHKPPHADRYNGMNRFYRVLRQGGGILPASCWK